VRRLAGIFLEHHEDARVLLSVKVNLMVEKIRARIGEGASIAPDINSGLIGSAI